MFGVARWRENRVDRNGIIRRRAWRHIIGHSPVADDKASFVRVRGLQAFVRRILPIDWPGAPHQTYFLPIHSLFIRHLCRWRAAAPVHGRAGVEPPSPRAGTHRRKTSRTGASMSYPGASARCVEHAIA